MCRLPSIALAAVLVLIAPAWAGDFTGFYAGVNGGDAFGAGKGRETGVSGPVPTAPAAENGLPPSALSASGRLDERRPGNRRAGAR